MGKLIKYISLGWGRDSFTLAAMSALGEIEKVDVAIFSDTKHEASGTYEFAQKWTPWLEEHGIHVVTVTSAPAGEADRWGGVFIPAFTDIFGKKGGQLRRQCTQRWKIAPMRRWMQAHRGSRQIELWIGISKDESLRMKPSNVKYIKNRWPLVEMNITRRDCEKWLKEHKLEVPPRSACTFCPFHDMEEWRSIKKSPKDWEEAVRVDRSLRSLRPPYDLFVYPARIPLENIDLRSKQEKKQMAMWDEECEGVCGV